MPSLVVLGGKSEGTVFDLSQGPELEIGTARKAQIQLRDRGVSYVHARITKRGDTFIIKDEGSRQGTTVNRKRLVEEQALRPGDVIAVGEVELRFEEGAPAPGSAPRPTSTPGPAPRPSPVEEKPALSSELARLEAARDAALAAQRAAEARAARAEAEKAALEQRLEVAAKELAATRSDLAEARQTLDEQNADLIAVQEELESLKEKLGE